MTIGFKLFSFSAYSTIFEARNVLSSEKAAGRQTAGRQAGRQTGRQTGRQADRQTVSKKYGLTDTKAYRKKDRQTSKLWSTSS